MIFFFIFKKITSVGSSAFWKKLQRLDQPTLAIFFDKEKNLISKKITIMGSKHHLNPIVVFFFEMDIFSFPKKITSVGWSSRCKFFWNAVDPTTGSSANFLSPKPNGQGLWLDQPTLVTFFAFLKKITTTR